MRLIATFVPLIAAVATTASPETLREALVATYHGNPTITGQRDALRQSDSDVAAARAAGLPSVSLTAGMNQDLTRSGGGNGRNASAGVDVDYPLFDGGSVRNSIRAAETRVDTSRYRLQAVEGETLVEAVTAYMDVLRQRAIVELNSNNVDVLDKNLTATRDLFKSGDLTRTDVAQSEARLALGRSQLVTAQGELTGSEENYRRVIGQKPGMLAPPPALPALPLTPDEAVQVALTNSSQILAAASAERAAGFDIRTARASRLPTLSVFGSGRFTDYLNTATEQFGPFAPNRASSTGVGVQARVPLYQGGGPAARIRHAQAIQGQLLEQAIGTERSVVAATRAAFASYQAALSAIASNQVAVSADELALDGARAERTVGTRTVLDVLNAEQELLTAQVQLVSARRDAYVSGFQLLNAMGQAQAHTLGLDGGPLYDPLSNYRRVSRNANDWSGDPDPVSLFTRRVLPKDAPVPAQQSSGVRSGVEARLFQIPAAASVVPGSTSGPDDLPAGAQAMSVRATGPNAAWRVQLGAFAKAASAQAMIRALPNDTLAGSTAGVTPGRGVFRVYVGPFATSEDAHTACAGLSARGRACFVTHDDRH